MAVVAWTFFLAVIVYLTIQLRTFEEPAGTITSASLGLIQLYRITADLCEYYVYTHIITYLPVTGNNHSQTTALEPTTVADDDDDDDTKFVVVEQDVETGSQPNVLVLAKVKSAKRALQKAVKVLEQNGSAALPEECREI